jgi:hypothetical protein
MRNSIHELCIYPIHPPGYRRRTPEQNVLHAVLSEHLETFLEEFRTEHYELPKYVKKELRDYLKCGILAYGFVRMRCDDCGESMAVGYSCKGRGFCPSCTGRRMADTSARLVDDTFPQDAPVRQWVLSLPINIRYRLAYDGKLLSGVLRIFLRVVNGWYKKQAKAMGINDIVGGVVTFAQRFGSARNLDPHFHSLVLDGVFNKKTGVWHSAPPLTDDDVKQIVETTAKRVVKLLRIRGVLDADSFDTFGEEQPVLAGITHASIKMHIAGGDRSGLPVRRVLQDPKDGVKTGNLCFAPSGFSLHAATRISEGDKPSLERLCNYVARPPLAAGSLQPVGNDQYTFKLKTAWSDGTTHLLLSGMEVVEKLVALVPPPRQHLVRYHGVLAPNAKLRKQIVPQKKDEEELKKERGSSKNRLLWAALLARTFNLDMETCCPRKLICVANE